MNPDIVVATHEARPISPIDVLALYKSEGWWPERTAEQVAAVLGSAPAAGAWLEDELVGFARAVSDGMLRAYVEDVIVVPQLRGTNIGRRLMDCLLGQLDAIPVVTLFCGSELVPFYESTGFAATKQVVLHR